MLDALEKNRRFDDGKEVRPFLTKLAENCFQSGIPEEDVVRWTRIYQRLELFEEEIRETIHTVYSSFRRILKETGDASRAIIVCKDGMSL